MNTPETFPCSQLNITVDLELAWSRARRGDRCLSREDSLQRGRIQRKVFESWLSLTEQYEIPITFATVGHLALKGCHEHAMPPAYQPEWMDEDWYAFDPRIAPQDYSLFFGFDLLSRIQSSPIPHEVGSHGFSHVDLTDQACTEEVAAFEIEAGTAALHMRGIVPTTFVFPNNAVAYTDLVARAGYTTYRSGAWHPLEREGNGLWKFPVGLWLSPLAYSPQEIHGLVEYATKHRLLTNFFFHLFEFENTSVLEAFFEPIFRDVAHAVERRQLAVNTIRDIIRNREAN